MNINQSQLWSIVPPYSLQSKYQQHQQNMHSFNNFETPIIHAIQRQYPDIKVNLKAPPQPQSQPLYTHTPNPPLSIGQLRYIAQAISQINPSQANSIANRILQFITNLISILENNQQCRLSWTSGTLRGRADKQNKISLPELQREISTLTQLIEQCRHGVRCKSQFLALMGSRRRQVFRQGQAFGRSVKVLYLPEMPQNYEHLQLVSEDSYLLIYESIMQKLLVYQNAVGQYLGGGLSFTNLQQICYELMRQDIVLINNNKTNELIKYAWLYCVDKYRQFSRARAKIAQLRTALLHSFVRTYYIAFIAKGQIQELNQSLQRAEGQLATVSTERNAYHLGRNSVVKGSSIEEMVLRLQHTFTSIFNYLTETNEGIFRAFYEKKLAKRVVALMKIQDRLTHFYKVIFNPDYADQAKAKANLNTTDLNSRMEKKMGELGQLYNEMRPINEKSFKIIFSEIQQLALYFQQHKAGKEWEHRLSEFERAVMNQHLFDERGQRKAQKDTPARRLANSRAGGSRVNGVNWGKSGANEHNRSFNSLQVTKEEVFEDSMQEYKFKKAQSQVQAENIDKEEVYREGRDFLGGILGELGSEFMDLVNCKAYLLPKLLRKAQIALSMTAYSEQPLYLHLVSLVDTLTLLQSIVRPELNEQKVHLIFYPKVNYNLFIILKTVITQHQDDLSRVYVQYTNDPIKVKNLPQNIKGFMQSRLKYIHTILENLAKLESLVVSIDSLGLKKHNYDIANQGTSQLILKLLLAQKELKANRLAISGQRPSKDPAIDKALRLFADVIYPNFINSINLIFQDGHQGQSLETLLQICESSNRVLLQSQQYFDTILRMVQDIVSKKNAVNFPSILQQWSITLRSYVTKIEELINGCMGYSCVSTDALSRQRIRVIEFIELVERGPNTQAQLLEGRSMKLREYLRMIPT